MKKIAISLGIIGVVAAIVIGATTAYFSDTETSKGNTFTAGTIDIAVSGQNPWADTFTLADMKPGYTDNITFNIQNTGSGANPVDVWKKITSIVETNGVETEPELEADPTGLVNDLSNQIIYDLSVEVYQGDQKIWWQTIYIDGNGQTINGVYDVYGDGKEVYLGMIPADGNMIVKQSYHFNPEAGNAYQGDIMTFDIQVRGEQLHGIAVLENKTGPESWLIVSDDVQGTLTYKVKNPTFDFNFTGKAPLANYSYVLAAGWKVNGAGFDVDKKLGTGTTDGNGNITITEDVDTGDMKNVKVWLVPAENWSDSTGMVWSNWPDCVPNILWETGLIWYEDTN